MATQREIELCQEILCLAMQANAQPTYSVWAEFHGHTSTFEVRISKKWTPNEPDIDGWSCFGDGNSICLSDSYKIPGIKPGEIVKRRIKALTKLKSDLSKLLAKEGA